jgi:hypothetical protein
MKPFKPDSAQNHAVNQVPDHEGDQAEENVETLMEHISTKNRYGDLQVSATDTTLETFNPVTYAKMRMRQD